MEIKGWEKREENAGRQEEKVEREEQIIANSIRFFSFLKLFITLFFSN